MQGVLGKESAQGEQKTRRPQRVSPEKGEEPRSPGGEELPVRQAGQGHAQTVQILQGDVHPPVQGRTKVVPPSGEEVSRPSPRSGSRCLSDHAPRGFHHDRPREIGLLVRTQAELPRKDQLLPLLLGHRGENPRPSLGEGGLHLPRRAVSESSEISSGPGPAIPPLTSCTLPISRPTTTATVSFKRRVSELRTRILWSKESPETRLTASRATRGSTPLPRGSGAGGPTGSHPPPAANTRPG